MLAGQLSNGKPVTMAWDALYAATVGGARCLGREGELGVIEPVRSPISWYGRSTDLLLRIPGDLVEAWLRNGPLFARHTIVNGRPVFTR